MRSFRLQVLFIMSVMILVIAPARAQDASTEEAATAEEVPQPEQTQQKAIPEPVKDETAKTPLRFAPGAIGAKFGAPLLLFDRNDATINFAHRSFVLDQFKFTHADGVQTITWDPKEMNPVRVVVIDGKGEVRSETKIDPAGMVLKIDGKDFSFSGTAIEGSEPGNLRVRLEAADANVLNELQLCVWDDLDSTKGTDTQIFCGPANESGDLRKGRFTLDGKAQPAKGEFQPKKVQFDLSIIAPNNVTFKWIARVPVAKVYEAYLRADNKIELVMYDGEPEGQADVLTPDRGAMFEATIGDLRKFARVTLAAKIPYLNLKGPRGSVVHQRLDVSALPLEGDRLFLHPNAPTTTYKSSIYLWGPYDGKKIDSKQKEVRVFGDEYRWEFATPKKYSWNRSRLNYHDSRITGSKTQTTVFDYEVYRGFATYLSARAALAVNAKLSVSAAADLAFQHWFEDLWSSASWSRQRWGISGGYMKTAVSSKKEEVYETTSFDINYRFTPGIEGWTETFGATVGAMGVNYQNTEMVYMGGAGIFWNRSLPNWFNYIVGFLDFLKKPKWANFSATYYGLPISANSKPSGVQLKALARIDLTTHSYFEGGWTLFAATYEFSKKKAQTGAGRIYLGYGLRF